MAGNKGEETGRVLCCSALLFHQSSSHFHYSWVFQLSNFGTILPLKNSVACQAVIHCCSVYNETHKKKSEAATFNMRFQSDTPQLMTDVGVS